MTIFDVIFMTTWMAMIKTLIQVPDAAVINMKANFVLPEVKDFQFTPFLSYTLDTRWLSSARPFSLSLFTVYEDSILGGRGFLFNRCLHRACPTGDSNDCIPGMTRKSKDFVLVKKEFL